MYRKTYIEINTQNLKHSVETLMHEYPTYAYYIGVVKGNAYGHGPESVQTLIDAGINYLAVSTLEEAIVLREHKITAPILCMQPIHISQISDALEYNVTITLSSYEFFKKLVVLDIQKELKIHLKINTGFNRLGISEKNEVKEIFDSLIGHKHFKLEGIYSHFMTSGRNDSHLEKQLKAFRDATSGIDLKQIPIVHLDRSLTLFSHEKIDICTGVRIGIALYGYGQSTLASRGLKGFVKNMFTSTPRVSATDQAKALVPAFSLYGEIIETHKIKRGDSVGYGAAFTAPSDCYIACVSLGYADGFFRKNKGGDVFIHGKRYMIISVDMGITTILVDETVKVGDMVEFIGKNISAKEVAVRNETTVYEIICEFKESIPRVLLKN